MSGLSNLWSKLARSKKYREAFVASQLKRGIPTQVRVLLKQRQWSQAELAERSGLTQGAISRAADPDYGNLTFNNVLKIAAGFDMAFVGKFIPFSELASWHDSIGDETALMVDSFDEDIDPQFKETSFEAALAAHIAAPAPMDYSDAVAGYYPVDLSSATSESLGWEPQGTAAYFDELAGEVTPVSDNVGNLNWERWLNELENSRFADLPAAKYSDLLENEMTRSERHSKFTVIEGGKSRTSRAPKRRHGRGERSRRVA